MRAILASSLPLVLLVLAATVSNSELSAFLAAAGVIALLVMLFETALARSRHSGLADDRAPRDSPDVATARLVDLLAFVGTSTPTLVGLARGAGSSVLTGWLNLVSSQVSRAFGRSTVGVMILREALEWHGGGFEPICQVEFVGGSQRCTLPPGSRIPIDTGKLPEDLRRSAGVRTVYLAGLDWNDQRYWICLTSTVVLEHELLQSLCGAMSAPVMHILLSDVAMPEMLRDVVDISSEPRYRTSD